MQLTYHPKNQSTPEVTRDTSVQLAASPCDYTLLTDEGEAAGEGDTSFKFGRSPDQPKCPFRDSSDYDPPDLQACFGSQQH